MAERKTQFRFFPITRVLAAAMLGWLGAHYFPVQSFFPQKQETLNLFTVRHIPAPQVSASPFGHPYYPYSVIPGGAHSRDELEHALKGDSVAARHYSDFITQNARVVTLDRDTQYYVSYRVGDKIYWTRHALTLRKGEKLLFDGVHYARARCGNRLAAVPTQPQIQLASLEPSPKIFTAPAPVQISLDAQTPTLDPAPDLPFELSSSRIEGLPEPLSNLADIYKSAGDSPGVSGYVPTRHDRVTLFALDGASPLTMMPIFYPTETPSVSAVPEPGTACLAGFILLVAIAAFALTKLRLSPAS